MRRLENFKKVETTQAEEGENKVSDILLLIAELHALRLVERISRPAPYLTKELLYAQFKQKMALLHELMNQLQRQYQIENGIAPKRAKNINKTNATVRGRYQREEIRRIENRYTEVFVEGSFRYYYRAAKANGVPTDLAIISIEEWTEETLKEEGEKCC